MKWTQKEVKIALSYLREGKSYKEIGDILGKTPSSVRNKMNENNEKSSNYFRKKQSVPKNCIECGVVYEDTDSRQNRKFCSQSCNATHNNRNRGYKSHNIKRCICGAETKTKFCSRNCYLFFLREDIKNKIENNENFHERTIKRYLIEKYGEKCMKCGWCEKHTLTNKVPIQLDHIDGNYENNTLDNLRLLCPNCHSLTITFGALNKGNGRVKERNRNKKQI